MSGIGQFFGNLFQPFLQLFHVVFFGPIFNVLMLLYEGVHAVAPGLPAFAIAIFFLTVAIRLCLFPLTRKQLQSSRAMQALQPQLQELQRKHKGDPQALMTAQRALQKEHGVSMAGGCLPMLVQLPFLYGLYYSLFAALIPPKLPNGKPLPLLDVPAAMLKQINDSIYPFLPHLPSVHALPSTMFLWADLGKVDHTYILPVLAGLLTFIQMRMAQPVKKPGAPKDANTQAMSSMMYVMPFITIFFGATFPAGLAFYWVISTGFSAVQQYLISGWGSLFVGIPGLEHLVPEPTVLPTVASRTASASALVPTSSGARSPGGLAGFRALLRQLTTPPPIDATDQSPGNAAANSKAGNGNGARNGVETATLGPDDSGNRTPNTSYRRTRPERAGPTLVKPPTTTNGATNGKAASQNGTAANGAGKAVGNGNGNGNGAKGGAGAAGTNVTPASSQAARVGGNTTPARGGGGQGKQSARRRSGHRAKGGR